MIGVKSAVQALGCVACLAACSTPADVARVTPDGSQANHPADTVKDPAVLERARIDHFQADINSVENTPVAGVAPSDITAAVFPDIGSESGARVGFELFQQTCLSHAPKVSKIAAAATALDLNIDRRGQTVTAEQFSGTTPLSLQVNNQSDFDFECAVTFVDRGSDDGKARDALFRALQAPQTNGVGSISVNGETFVLKHLAFGGGAFGVTEHAYLLQK